MKAATRFELGHERFSHVCPNGHRWKWAGGVGVEVKAAFEGGHPEITAREAVPSPIPDEKIERIELNRRPVRRCVQR